MQNRFYSSPASIPIMRWYAKATLVSSQQSPPHGSLLECVRAWDRLPARLRATSYIVVKEDENDEYILHPKELEKYIRDKGFLSL